MRRKLLGALGALLLIGVGWTPEVYADTCEARISTDVPDFQAGKPSPIICDTHGQPRTLLVTPNGTPVFADSGSTGTGMPSGQATAATPTRNEGAITGFSFDLAGNVRVIAYGRATATAPVYAEGSSTGSFSFDLAGNARVTMGTLLFGEDSTNSLIRTSGGAVRITQILGTGGIPSTATDATSATSILPVGMKTFQGVETCTGTCVQTQKIYGTYANAATVAASDLVCTLTLNASTTATDWCKTDKNYAYWFVVTSATSGTTPLSGIFVQY